MIQSINNLFLSQRFVELSSSALAVNPWFTEEFISTAVRALREEFLDEAKVEGFCAKYNINREPKAKTVGVVCAGNIPLVGFGDMFYSLLCGWNVVLKTSSKDPLMQVFEELGRVEVATSLEELEHCDAIILMGSDTTCELLREMYPDKPLMLRGSMHSVAIIRDSLTLREANLLYIDMLLYCGRGCRNVSHLYLPEGFKMEFLVESILDVDVIDGYQMPKIWLDQYRYARAMAQLRGERVLDSGVCLFKEMPMYGSNDSLVTITYSFYKSEDEIPLDKIQHIATHGTFGRAQFPTLYDFANKESVVEFLGSL